MESIIHTSTPKIGYGICGMYEKEKKLYGDQQNFTKWVCSRCQEISLLRDYIKEIGIIDPDDYLVEILCGEFLSITGSLENDKKLVTCEPGEAYYYGSNSELLIPKVSNGRGMTLVTSGITIQTQNYAGQLTKGKIDSFVYGIAGNKERHQFFKDYYDQRLALIFERVGLEPIKYTKEVDDQIVTLIKV